MAIGKRIKFFRTMRGMTQKQLGTAIGFPAKNVEVRLAQYEIETRKPKADLIAKLAKALSVSPQALNVPDIDSNIGIMQTLFCLEDTHGIVISNIGVFPAIAIDTNKSESAKELLEELFLWHEQATFLAKGAINKHEYDPWRYNYSIEKQGEDNANE